MILRKPENERSASADLTQWERTLNYKQNSLVRIFIVSNCRIRLEFRLVAKYNDFPSKDKSTSRVIIGNHVDVRISVSNK